MDVFRGRLSWRKLAMLLAHLPADSACARLVNDGDPWDTSQHLLAMIADGVHEVAWVTAQANSREKVARPEPIPRPGRKGGRGHQPDHKTKRKHASIEDLRRFFGQPAGR